MEFWKVSDGDNKVYFSSMDTMLKFISIAFYNGSKINYISDGIHAMSCGSPFWVSKMMIIV